MTRPTNGALKTITTIIGICIGVSGFTYGAAAWRWSGLCDDVRAAETAIKEIQVSRATTDTAVAKDIEGIYREMAALRAIVEANY